MTTAHAWMPSSACGASCLPSRVERVRRGTVLLRWMAIAAVLCAFPLMIAARVLPSATRRAVVTGAARLLLRAVGISLEVDRGTAAGVDRGTAAGVAPPTESKTGTLVVANHVSWTDIVVLSALYPARFVARADLLDWPVLGTVSRLVRVIPIERGSLRSLPRTVDHVADLLRSGRTVVVFPEGTTWCGRAYGTFRPALFQAAIDAGASVQPLKITYSDGRGQRTTATAFIGDEGIGTSISRIVAMAGLRVTVRISEKAAHSSDRRELAARCERAVHGPVVLPHPVTVPVREPQQVLAA